MQIPNTARRRRARMYIELAERHLADGDSEALVGALVRAAWDEHRKADADACASARRSVDAALAAVFRRKPRTLTD